MQKMPPETDGFWTSFCVQELLPKFRRSRESAFFYSRCRYIGWLKGAVLLPGESILPSGRTTSFFIWAGAAAGLLLSQFPRHLISNETLEGKGNPKPLVSAGVLWRLSARRQTHIIFHAYFSAFSGNLQHRGVYCRIRPPKAFPSHVRWERTFHHRKEAAGWKLCCGSCGSSGRYRSWRS